MVKSISRGVITRKIWVPGYGEHGQCESNRYRDKEIADNGTTFEESLDELEALVDRLERGQLLLDESLELFERGMKLARICNMKLSKAERKIEKLIEENGKIKVGTFNEDG